MGAPSPRARLRGAFNMPAAASAASYQVWMVCERGLDLIGSGPAED